jgi:hypothetical protein
MRTIRTPGKRRIVLDAVSNGLTIAEAARLAGIARSSVFDWKATDPAFAREFEEAYQAGTDCFEVEARKRAFTESDTLLIFLLKARDLMRFARKLVEVAGDRDHPVLVSHTGDAPDMMPEEHRRSGDAADALFRVIKRRIAAKVRTCRALRPPTAQATRGRFP